MNSILQIGQLVSAIIVIVLVLLQEGSGLSQVFGGANESFHVKRGLEKIVFILTVLATIIFIGLSIANLVF